MIEDPNLECSPGDILWSDNNKNIKHKTVHYMVFLQSVPNQPHLFCGAMLTTANSPKYNNEAIPNDFFESNDENGNAFKFPNAPTYIRKRFHLKMVDWAPFHLSGRLTPEGLALVQGLADCMDAVPYEYNVVD